MKRTSNKLKLSLLAAAAFGLLLPQGVAYAQSWEPVTFKVNDPDMEDLARTRNGRLRKTDEEFTNEQAVVKFFGNGTNALYVEMRTGRLSTGEAPVHRMQAACVPLELTQGTDGTVTFQKLPGEKFVTDNRGNEYRNANKPELMPIDGGKYMLLMFNYQPNNSNDTRRYVKVLDMQCNEMPLVDANGNSRKQVQIMHKNNDDCDMHQSGEGPAEIVYDAGGKTRLVMWAGCNGNGRDDGWLNMINVVNDNGTFRVTKEFDLSLARREERSRGRCTIADEDPDTAICTWTEGNNQPQREGTWIAAVNISEDGEKGENAQSRLIWKEQIDGRKEVNGRRTYSVRAMHTRVLEPQPDGSLKRSNMIFVRTGDLYGRNNNNKKGGEYRAFQLSVIKATREGMEYVTPKTDATQMLLGLDGTHLTMCGAVMGEGSNLMPGFTLLQGSQNGGGVQEPTVKAIAWDATTKQFVSMGEHRAGGSYDRHLYSNYLGNNPGNQGRNFAGCTLIQNPFFGRNGSTAQYFVVHALTGKDPMYVDRPELKPSSYVTLLPVAFGAPPAPPATETPTQDPPASEEPPSSGDDTTTPPSTDDGTSDDGSIDSQPAGCSVAAGTRAGQGGALLLIGLALLGLVRRRK